MFLGNISKGENRMNRLLQDIRVSDRVLKGPLEPYIHNYASRLFSEGYARASRRVKIRLAGSFSRWLGRKGTKAHEVVDQDADDFLCYCHRGCRRHGQGDPATLRQLMKMLREEGVITSQPRQVAATPSERLVEEYRLYLQNERVLSLAARINYSPFIREFLFLHAFRCHGTMPGVIALIKIKWPSRLWGILTPTIRTRHSPGPGIVPPMLVPA
jgi:hypothetical protein